mmetsp:Transcript_19040/g.53067  ORF Transcript_19040/g.53067 Transcript_19040/m.53067 type:complete len:324 (+) Transcript_19040:669-1640(+)
MVAVQARGGTAAAHSRGGVRFARPSAPASQLQQQQVEACARVRCAAMHRQRSGEQHRPRWPPESVSDVRAFSNVVPCQISTSLTHKLGASDFMRKKAALQLPDVDWSCKSIRVLFVDRSDTVRGRMATGLMDIVSEWNNFRGLIIHDRCGMDAEADEYLQLSTTAALLSRSYPLGISAEHFVGPCIRFEGIHLLAYDLIIAMDTDVETQLLLAARQEACGLQSSDYYRRLRGKIALLTDFFGWCSYEFVCPQGPPSVLPQHLLDQLSPKIEEARRSPDVMRPDLSSPEGMDEWHDMNSSLLLGCASLMQYLMDGFPGQLPENT